LVSTNQRHPAVSCGGAEWITIFFHADMRGLRSKTREARLRSSIAADSTKTAEGNIYNNKAESFDIALLEEDNTAESSGKLYNPHEDSDKKRQYDFEVTEGTMPELITDINGNIVTASGKKVWLGIRPESAEKAYPGDDLILTFTAEDKRTNVSTDGTDGQKAIASYTYDIRGLQVESVKKQQVEFCRRRLQNSESRTAQQFCGALHVRRTR